MKQLDRKRPFFTVHGDTSGAAFAQDNALFDREGKEIAVEAEAEAEEAPAPKKAAPKKAAKPAVDDQLDAQLGAQ